MNNPINLSDPTGWAVDCSNEVFDCAKKLFNVTGKRFVQAESGKIGRFEGTTADGRDITLFNDAQRFSTDELSYFRDHWLPMDPSGPIRGLTSNTCRWARFRFYCFDYHTSYTANNLPLADTAATARHELGHQLAREVGLVPKNFEDEDPWGARMEDCIARALLKRQQQKPH